MLVLDDNGFIVWESNAILHYLALKAPSRGLWPSDTQKQSYVLRWLFWESAHWDQQACGAVGHELVSRRFSGWGRWCPNAPRRGCAIFTALQPSSTGTSLDALGVLDATLTIADFALGSWVPMARALQLPVEEYPEIVRWYGRLASLPAWQASIAAPPTAEAASALGSELA